MKKSIAVTDIAKYLYASGDLTSEFFSNRDLSEGTRAHNFLQEKYNSNSLKEYFIKQVVFKDDNEITVSGRIDGVLIIDGEKIIEEIKSTKKEFDELSINYHPEYLAQLKIYAYMYASQNNMNNIKVRLTYISLITYETKSFDMTLSIEDLEKFFFESVDSYLIWLMIIDKSEKERLYTIKDMEFPYSEYRLGQKEMMKKVYETFKRDKILYAIAPTGIGKTIATIFSGLKSLENENEKLFYLTAKGMGKTVVLDTLRLLQSRGLKLKSIVLTAKAKCCLASMKNCDPERCEYAKGFFSRLSKATTEIYEENDIFDFETIDMYAKKHTICPFEFSLYLSYFADFIVADYNYVFDPRAHLIRYFDDDTYAPKILVDEAHNLISRSKEMYSASLSTIDLRTLRKNVSGIKPNVRDDLNKAIDMLESYEDKISIEIPYFQETIDLNIFNVLKRIENKVETILSDNRDLKNREEILGGYFLIHDFIRISDFYGPMHRFLVKKIKDEEIEISILCLDASEFIYDTIINHTHGVVFFSATLFPIKYHMDLLTKGEGDEITLKSSFDDDNLNLIINDKISTLYKSRGDSIEDIIEIIDTLVTSKSGNYIIFFPSYAYMNLVVNALGDKNYEYFVQKSNMNDIERDVYLKRFEGKDPIVGFFVLGGVFAEGIDYIGDLLSGVIIVGVGLPQLCIENNLLKEYFEKKEINGFDYAYTYPGFNKVVQAAGRVIRSETDYGVVVLIDRRYGQRTYQNIMPESWRKRKIINKTFELKKELAQFWGAKKLK